MKQKLATVVVTTAALFWSGAATAQEFGSKGGAVFGAERLMGVHSDHVFQDPQVAGTPGIDYSVTSFGLGWFALPATPFDMPRLAFDYFIVDSWSLGGALAYQSSSYTNNNNGRGAVTPAGDAEFLLAPRVGYSHMFGRAVGIWPRAGLTYHSDEVDGDRSVNGFAVGLEAMFVFIPVQHFAFTAGPSFDIDFTGRTKPNQGSNVSHGYRSLGLQIGLLGWL